jgi:hypothetical protein
VIDQPALVKIDDPLGDAARAFDWLREHVTPAMIRLTASKDRAIGEALQAIQPLWTCQEIARRCVFLRSVGSEGETLFVDGIAVLIFEPGETTQEWRDDRLVITYTQKFKRVQAVKL